MNIFVLDSVPQFAAKMHCDQHVRKMIVESAQMLSTAHHILQSKHTDSLYKPTHPNHPCNIWVRSSYENYNWLVDLWFALCNEYQTRFDKPHKTFVKLQDYIWKAPPAIPQKGLLPFVQCMPDEYKHEDAIVAYHNFYIHKKKLWKEKYSTRQHLWMRYTETPPPQWLIGE